MNTKQYTLITLLSAFSFASSFAKTDPLTIQYVSQQVAEDDGYRFFTFTSDATSSYRIVAFINGKEEKVLTIRSANNLIVAVKLSVQNGLEAVRAFYPSGKISISYKPSLRSLTFNNVISESAIQLDSSFLSMTSPTNTLELKLVAK